MLTAATITRPVTVRPPIGTDRTRMISALADQALMSADNPLVAECLERIRQHAEALDAGLRRRAMKVER